MRSFVDIIETVKTDYEKTIVISIDGNSKITQTELTITKNYKNMGSFINRIRKELGNISDLVLGRLVCDNSNSGSKYFESNLTVEDAIRLGDDFEDYFDFGDNKIRYHIRSRDFIYVYIVETEVILKGQKDEKRRNSEDNN